MAAANAVFSGFRRLSRSAKFAFGKDKFALVESRRALKAEFIKNRNVTDPNEIDELLKGIEEADEVLRFNIVQGALNDKGNYEVQLSEPSHQITVDEGQCETHGAALEPIDMAILGDLSNVRLDKTTNTKRK